MKALLPVAGNGTRMYPLGVTTPKCLVSILNKPLILWSLEALAANGVDEVILVISAGVFGAKIREYVSQLQLPNLTIKFAVQEQQLGTAHVVQVAKEFFGANEAFIFMYGDDLYGPGNIAQIAKYEGLAVTGMKVNDPEKWGIFEIDADQNLTKVTEKPTTFVGDLANIGCMKLNSKIFELYDQLTISSRGEYELTDSLQLLAATEKVRVFATTDYWIPIGYPWHILEATEYFLPKITSNIEGTVDKNVSITGNVILPKSSIIKSGTVIEGNVIVGERVTIGPNAYLRDNITIGNDSKVGFSVEVKNTVIGERTHIPHLSYIGDSVLGNDVNFAGGSIASNLRHDEQTIRTPIKGTMTDTKRKKFGTVIGDGVKLGASTTIYPGRKIWPGRTTRPGEIVNNDIVG